MANIVKLPYVKLSDKKAETQRIMAIGNEVLAHYHQKLVKGSKLSRRDFRIHLFKQMDKHPGQDVNIFGILVPKHDLDKIKAVRAIEYKLQCGYSGIVAKIANLVWRRERDIQMDFDDLYQEGVVSLTNAIYYYTDPTLQFSTYCQRVIYRELTIAANKNKPLSHWSTRARRMVLAYQYELAKHQCNGPVTFEEVVKKMNWTKQQANILNDLMIRVLNESALETGDNGDEPALASLADERGYVPDLDLQDALESVRQGLKTKFEIDIYNCLLNDSNLTDVARSHGVTRQYAHQIAVRIRTAIRNAYDIDDVLAVA